MRRCGILSTVLYKHSGEVDSVIATQRRARRDSMISLQFAIHILYALCSWAITMTIGWLLLLQLLMVASQSTTDDDVCDGGLLRREIAILSSQVQSLQQFISKRLGKHYEAI